MPRYQNQDRNRLRNHPSNIRTVEIDDFQDNYGNAEMMRMMNSQAEKEDNTSEIPASLRSPYDEVYLKHVLKVDTLRIGLTETQLRDMNAFINNWEANRSRYETVSRETDMPAKLIAALHWRESTGNFNTYLHQGDPLGRAAVNFPYNIPTFYSWENAAVHALDQKKHLQTQLEMTSDTTNTASIATYAEAYNGLGYHNANRDSPYVYSGTNHYSAGKYVRDGQFSRTTVDSQIGVMPLVGALHGLNATQDLSPKAVDKGFLWQKILNGQQLLRRGDSGPMVEVLQKKLSDLGYAVTVDGEFGGGTERVIREFQRLHNLNIDSAVGSKTATEIENRKRRADISRPHGNHGAQPTQR
jgi:lysozyme family protein